ncbi:hypothetical protein F5B20DRAFT_324631 [Whalleya microplaca]|nr:hypothetical protein F5B20DRAFT_324631 [Whalleya microplaca]
MLRRNRTSLMQQWNHLSRKREVPPVGDSDQPIKGEDDFYAIAEAHFTSPPIKVSGFIRSTLAKADADLKEQWILVQGQNRTLNNLTNLEALSIRQDTLSLTDHSRGPEVITVDDRGRIPRTMTKSNSPPRSSSSSSSGYENSGIVLLHMQEDNFYARPSVKLIIPEDLRSSLLMAGGESRERQPKRILPPGPLPHPHPVTKIFEDYSSWET